jgi:hypothetical protein
MPGNYPEENIQQEYTVIDHDDTIKRFFQHSHSNTYVVPILGETNPVLRLPPCFFEIHINISFQFTSMLSKRSISFRFTNQNHVGTSVVLHTSHTPLPICCSLLWTQYTLRSSRWYRSCVHFRCSPSARYIAPVVTKGFAEYNGV